MELRFPLFGVYDPLGCAKWYYQSPAQRTFSDADIKVSWAVLIIQADIKLDMSSGTPVLNILIDITDPDSVSFNEGNLNEGLDSRIQKMTIDPDWKGTPADWYSLVSELMGRNYDSFFGLIDNLVTLGIGVADINEMLTVPLDPLMQNYNNMLARLQKCRLSFKSIGFIDNPIATTQFKMWEEKTSASQHQDGICAVGMEFMQPIDAAKWNIAKTKFIPANKQFAISISNYVLNAVLHNIAEACDKPSDPRGELRTDAVMIIWLISLRSPSLTSRSPVDQGQKGYHKSPLLKDQSGLKCRGGYI